MKTLALHEMGEVIRRVRKERGLRLEDLADNNISPATVSNIERGVAHVSPEKVTYLLDKLDLPPDKLPEMLTQEQEELKRIEFELLAIASLRKVGRVDEALDRLKQLKTELDDNHPYIVHVYYHIGECYLSRQKWKQAERALFTAIRLLQQNTYREHNMEAAIYLTLGLLQYKQNDLEQAIVYTNTGIDAFHEDGENQHVKTLLYRNKGVYLQRLGRVAEGMRLVHEVWDFISPSDDVITALSFYWLRAEFSRLSGLLDEAVQYAMKGIEISRRNEQYDSMCDLWTVLGSVYTAKKDWDLAETAFSMAISLEDKFPQDKRLSTVYAQMAIMYMQQDRHEKTYQSLLTAIEYAEKFNDAPRLSSCLRIMGDVCRIMGKLKQAITFYNKALKVAEKHDYAEKEARIWFSLARCYDGENTEEFNHCMRNMYDAKKKSEKQGVGFIEESI